MGFFSSIFGTPQTSEEGKFDTLRDDGVRAMQMGELPYAEKCLKAALELRDDDKTKAFLAEVYLHMNQYDAALPLLEVLCAAHPDDKELNLLWAQTLGKLEKWEKQRDVCAALLKTDATEARALYLSAQAEKGLGDYLTAIVHLTQCTTLRPDFHSARLLRAQVLEAMGQWNEVLADTEALVETNPENEEYQFSHARALSHVGREDEAIQQFEAVLQLNPFNREAILCLGRLYESTSRRDKALKLYTEAIDLMPDFAEAYNARGGVKHQLKDDAGAAEDLKRSLELAPEKAAELDGEYTNVENEMNQRYRNLNPYGF